MKHTWDHLDCPACSAWLSSRSDALLPTERFHEASEKWLESKRTLRPSSWNDLRCCVVALNKFFAHIPLATIHAGHLRSYAAARRAGDSAVASWAAPAGERRTARELHVIRSIMRCAQLWTEDLQEATPSAPVLWSPVPRVIASASLARLANVAKNGDALLASWITLAAATTASTYELRSLKMGDIASDASSISIRRETAKNRYRVRDIPIVGDRPRQALLHLMHRAQGMGASCPSHYLFPFRVKRGVYDPTRCMSASGLKRAWSAARKEAGIPKARLYDLRHTAITRLAETGAPQQVIMAFAGHVTESMQRHYTAIGMASKRDWASRIQELE